jgi:cytochrome b6-f complex iron-sulfur subunit
MSPTTLFAIGIVASGVLAILGIFAVAFRRGDGAGPVTAPELDRRAIKADRARRKVEHAERTAVATLERIEVEEEEAEGPPPPDPVLQRVEVTAADYAVTRRQFFNRAVLGVFGLFLAQFAITGLAFFWPKLKGGFGTPIAVGKVVDLKVDIIQGATFVPKFVASAQSWIVPFNVDDLPGSSFETVPFVVAGGEADGVGLMALWQRCVHLGCRVPSCVPSQGFECPCHGSKYNLHGEYEQGPAPRNLDRFGVSVNATGELVVDTGNIVQTARSKSKTITYPQGPFCV